MLQWCAALTILAFLIHGSPLLLTDEVVFELGYVRVGGIRTMFYKKRGGV